MKRSFKIVKNVCISSTFHNISVINPSNRKGIQPIQSENTKSLLIIDQLR